MVASSGPPSDNPSPRSSSSDAPSERHEQAVEQFVQFWGEMGSSWGINRTMAKIHALLYCVEEPLNTDQIMERLDISRGNANMNLRSLTDWNLVTKTRKTGSRKDYYAAEKDVWQITEQIIREREKRELQPVKGQLEDCIDTLVPEDGSPEDLTDSDRVLYHRMNEFLDLIDLFEGFSAALLPLVQNREVSTIAQLVDLARYAQERAEASEGEPSTEEEPSTESSSAVD